MYDFRGVSYVKNVRLKMALHPLQVQDRLKYNPEIIEFHLTDTDLNEQNKIVKYTRDLKSQGIKVYLHHPVSYNGQCLDIISSSKKMRDYYDWSCKELSAICKQENVKCVVHCHYSKSESGQYVDRSLSVEMRKRLEKILTFCEKDFLWENTTRGIFSAENPFLLHEIVAPLDLPLTIDISHSFIALKGNNEKLKKHLDIYHPFAKYYHLVDSNGAYHDALPLGKGKIDWSMVKPFVKNTDFIFEIDLRSSNYTDCLPMIESAKYYNQL